MAELLDLDPDMNSRPYLMFSRFSFPRSFLRILKFIREGPSLFIWKAVAILSASLLLGFFHHLFIDTRVLYEADSASETEQRNSISLEDAKKAFDSGAAVFIDARSSLAYEAGHIRGAINLPASKIERLGREVEENVSKDTWIITYCSGFDCQSSGKLAELFISHGYVRVNVFPSGWLKWVDAGYPGALGGHLL